MSSFKQFKVRDDYGYTSELLIVYIGKWQDISIKFNKFVGFCPDFGMVI